MKKRLVIGLAVTLVMGVLSGCGSDKEGVGNNSAENSTESTQMQTM